VKGSDRPRRSESVTLHEVTSEREGTRYVLEHPEQGRAFDLPLGDGDAFVWARLDGEHTLEEIGAEFLEEHGSLHPDLAGMVERLRLADLLSEDAPPSKRDPMTLGERLAELAAAVAMVRVPVPMTQPLWRGIGRVCAPAYATPVGALALLVAVLGAVSLFAGSLTQGPTELLVWPGSDSLLVGLLVLLGLNLAVDLFEATAQVAVMARGKRPPGRIGVSFDLGVPGIYIETPDAVLLPIERRVRLFLAPLISAAFVAGLATLLYSMAHGKTGPLPEVLTGPVGLVVLHKLSWVAWLRCVFHLNPLGPSPVYDALSAWWSVPRLRRQAWRFLRGGLDLDGQPGFDRREQLVLLYLGLTIVFALGVTQVGVTILQRELLPSWHSAQLLGSGGSSQVYVLGALLVAVALPSLLALTAGALLLLQATAQALNQSELFETPARQAAFFLVAVVGVALVPGLLRLPPHHILLLVLWPLATLFALAAGGAGLRLAHLAGRGWGALGGYALSTAGLCLFVWIGAEGLNVVQPVVAGGFFVRTLNQGAALAFSLAVLSWGLIEAYRWVPGGARLRTLLALAAMGLLFGMTYIGDLERAAASLGFLAGGLGVLSVVAARGSDRMAGLALGGLGCLVWAGSLQWTTRIPSFERLDALIPLGVHAPLLAAGLLAAAAWILGESRRDKPQRPPFADALDEAGGSDPVRALSWLLRGLLSGVREELGGGALAAVRAALREHGVDGHLEGADGFRAEDLGGDDPFARRLATAVVRAHQEIADRGGDELGHDMLTALAQRLPAVAHEALRGSGVTLLSPLSAMSAVSHAERTRLLGRVVHFTDFPPEGLGELADQVGLRLVDAHETLIRQGEEGDTFYVLVSGRARVIVEDAAGEERVVARLGPDDAFGEGALLRHEPRTATVWIDEDALLLTLEREAFAAFLRRHKDLLAAVFARQADLSLVREVPLFAHLTGGQVTALCRRFVPQRVETDQAVIEEGAAGDRFYLIRDGRFEVRHEGSDEAIATLGRGDYFGEIALLRDVPRTATVTAKGEGELLALGRDDFRSLLRGATGQRLARRSQKRLDELDASGQVKT
jgi:CRP-like cAMP-binding protein